MEAIRAKLRRVEVREIRAIKMDIETCCEVEKDFKVT